MFQPDDSTAVAYPSLRARVKPLELLLRYTDGFPDLFYRVFARLGGIINQTLM
jgi:hypothetical protein